MAQLAANNADKLLSSGGLRAALERDDHPPYGNGNQGK